jgi:hypothetical protein
LSLAKAEVKPFLRRLLLESPFAMKGVALEIFPNLGKVLHSYLFQ